MALCSFLLMNLPLAKSTDINPKRMVAELEKIETSPGQTIESAAEEFVLKSMEASVPPENYLDAAEPVKSLKKAVDTLAEAAGLPEEDRKILTLAAAFHNVGSQSAKGKKAVLAESQRIAEDFLTSQGVKKQTIETVKRLIAAQESGHEPADLLEKCFLDACFTAYGSVHFPVSWKKQKEKSSEDEDESPSIEKLREEVNALKKHSFYTIQAQELFREEKEEIAKKAKKRLDKMKEEQESLLKATSVSANKGSLTMFKTALRNHIDLTQIADNKANIMLSVNALIITIGLPAFSTYLAGKAYLLVPGVVFIATSVVSMVFATLATRPIKMSGVTDLTKLKTGRTNLFFFGNFYRLPRDTFEEAIKKIVSDTEYLDSAFINDLYYLGLALGSKFRYLRICYNIFMVGIILSATAFIVAYLIRKDL